MRDRRFNQHGYQACIQVCNLAHSHHSVLAPSRLIARCDGLPANHLLNRIKSHQCSRVFNLLNSLFTNLHPRPAPSLRIDLLISHRINPPRDHSRDPAYSPPFNHCCSHQHDPFLFLRRNPAINHHINQVLPHLKILQVNHPVNRHGVLVCGPHINLPSSPPFRHLPALAANHPTSPQFIHPYSRNDIPLSNH